jgi:hypothetical protein
MLAVQAVDATMERSLIRALFTLGHVCRWFAFDKGDVPTPVHTIPQGEVRRWAFAALCALTQLLRCMSVSCA